MQLVQIKGITCEACIKLVKAKLGKLAGVSNVIVQGTKDSFQLISEKPYTKEAIQLVLNGTAYTVV